jgi:hypothetical protein
VDKRTSLPVKKKMLRSFEELEAVHLASQRHMQAERILNHAAVQAQSLDRKIVFLKYL